MSTEFPRGGQGEVIASNQVLSVEKAEVELGLDFFRKREDWLRLLDNDAKSGVEEMIKVAKKSENYPEDFMLLVGARDINAKTREGADQDIVEFLDNAYRFVNSLHTPLPYREASGLVPSDLGAWLRTLTDNLYTASKELGDEVEFREVQSKFQDLQKVKEEEERSKFKKAA